MNFFNRFLALAFTLIITIFSCFSAFAVTAEEALTVKNKIIAVSYRGDTENYPENSLEAILSAKEIGADMVSRKSGAFSFCSTPGRSRRRSRR